MLSIYTIATIWFALAILAAIFAKKIKISVALMEICIGAGAGYAATYLSGFDPLQLNSDWLRFISGSGAIILTFLAGAELDPVSFREKLKETSLVGVIGFLAPVLGCAFLAWNFLGWDLRGSLLAGIAMSCTSIAVVYAVMLEYGFNQTEFGKGILGSCFINDLATVLMLGLLFAPLNFKTLIFVAICGIAFMVLPVLTKLITSTYAFKTAEIRTKWILFVLFGLGALALWAGSEAVLPAYIVGMVLAGVIGKDSVFVRRIRTLTMGFLTPFYFMRAGALVSIPMVLAAPAVFLVLLAGKISFKIFGLYPVIRHFRNNHVQESWYYTLLMSTGLTFGTIAALYGLQHGIVSHAQYSCLVAVIIVSAVIPTMIANMYFVPRHLLTQSLAGEEDIAELEK